MEVNSVIRLNGYRALVKELGPIEAEKFISLIQPALTAGRQEPFDYTEWQKHLWADKTVEEISAKATEYRKSSKDA